MAAGLDKEKELEKRMKACGIFERDLEEKFILGSGSGGQKVNKTSSAVYLKHKPSGLEVKCQAERSRSLNRYYARKILCEKMERLLFNKKSAKDKEIAKIRAQKKRRSRRSKEKMLEEKKRHSTIKAHRKPPKED